MHATETERTQAMLSQSRVASKPLEQLIRDLPEYEDISKQPPPEDDDFNDRNNTTSIIYQATK